MSILEASGPVHFAPVALASGTTELVAAVADRKIRVLAAPLVADGTATLKFQSASTDLTGAVGLADGERFPADFFNGAGHFETALGEALNAVLSASTVNGSIVYQLVK